MTNTPTSKELDAAYEKVLNTIRKKPDTWILLAQHLTYDEYTVVGGPHRGERVHYDDEEHYAPKYFDMPHDAEMMKDYPWLAATLQMPSEEEFEEYSADPDYELSERYQASRSLAICYPENPAMVGIYYLIPHELLSPVDTDC